MKTHLSCRAFFCRFICLILALMTVVNCSRNMKFSKEAIDLGSNSPPVPTLTPSPVPTETPPPVVANSIIEGLVTNAVNANPIGGVLVTLTCTSCVGFGSRTLSTAANGVYRFEGLEAGTYQLKFEKSGFITYVPTSPVLLQSSSEIQVNASLSPILPAGNFRIVLTWAGPGAARVRDVDSYLMVPTESNPIYFGNKNGTGANLDVDDADWEGPETITITSQQTGTYSYYVVNYDESLNLTWLGQSKVKVTVYKGSQMIKEYQVPQGSGIIYKLFTLNGSSITDDTRYLPNPHLSGFWCITGGLKFVTLICPL